jgi:hypothetical protein
MWQWAYMKSFLTHLDGSSFLFVFRLLYSLGPREEYNGELFTQVGDKGECHRHSCVIIPLYELCKFVIRQVSGDGADAPLLPYQSTAWSFLLM